MNKLITRKQNNHLVIMAGGVGSRLWPMSTPDIPKQFVDVLGCGRTLIQLTMDRFKGICPPGNIWVVTSGQYAEIVKQQLPEIKDDHILREPCRRNTAPCIAYVSWKIKSIDPNANMVVTPSDHIVLNTGEFQRVITSSLEFTNNNNAIIVLGMTPTRPETGYGYIHAELGAPLQNKQEIYRVKSFREKPDLATAEKYIQEKSFFWNAGIFIWSVETVIDSFQKYQPLISDIFENMAPYYFTEEEQQVINERFPLCENISIDYAIMEKSKDIFVFPASFGWSDLGTWGSLHANMKRDVYNNAVVGDNIKMISSNDCVVHTTSKKQVIIQGLDGYVVAEKDDKLLICQLSEEQRIKDFLCDN